MKKIVIFIGTRPEAIKLVPIISLLKTTADFHPIVVSTGQHQELLQQVIGLFNIEIDVDLKIMRPHQQLAPLTANLIMDIDDGLKNINPQMVLVQGDTTSAFIATLASFYQRIPVGHVEAGLRTNNIYSPFPEECNRRLITPIATLHFAPTESARLNLLQEGVKEANILVTGNTGIDTLLTEVKRQDSPGVRQQIYQSLNPILGEDWNTKPFVLITGHRRENFGTGFEQICNALILLAESFLDHNFIYPVHLNPNVQQPVYQKLGHLSNIKLISPVNYSEFVTLMRDSKLILTDSGGVQEEAPSLGKPVLVMREVTERIEGIAMKATHLVGVNTESIFQTVQQLLSNDNTNMNQPINLYGDGQAARRIVQRIKQYFISESM
ncbi:MAG: UDP-N-acetylglucosamine 2-epimerase (non-hydrolyzing) [Thioploca sp.]|nr:UDP-N-acetylglucosamine 2-epimerase (non-hydrolyzing) [Thioploca sp.]